MQAYIPEQHWKIPCLSSALVVIRMIFRSSQVLTLISPLLLFFRWPHSTESMTLTMNFRSMLLLSSSDFYCRHCYLFFRWQQQGKHWHFSCRTSFSQSHYWVSTVQASCSLAWEFCWRWHPPISRKEARNHPWILKLTVVERTHHFCSQTLKLVHF